METEPAQRRFRGRVWWNAGGAGGEGAACGGEVQAPGTDGAGRGRADKGRGQGHGKERNQVAGMDSGGLGVPLFCASAKRSRLLPEVFDDRSYVGRRLSPRERAIIRELNETAFPGDLWYWSF